MKFFVSGLASVETTLAVRGFPVTYYPVDYPFFGINTEVAGSGFRTARGLLALGEMVDFMTLVGDDVHGRQVQDAILSTGMSCDHVYKKLRSTVESVVLQEMPFGRRQLYCDLKDAQENSIDANSIRSAIEAADVCALLNVNFSRPFISLAKSMGKKIATDVQALSDVNDPFNAEFIENADILFLSDEGISTSAADFIKALIGRSKAEVIVMGLGEDGVIYYDRKTDKIQTLKSVARNGVITAGAGAALFSGFLHYYGKYGCDDAIKRAEVYAALKLESNPSPSGEYPNEAAVEKRLTEVSF